MTFHHEFVNSLWFIGLCIFEFCRFVIIDLRLYKFFAYKFPLVSYNQAWFKGDADADGGHVHEGIQLAARDGFVAVGETLNGNTKKVSTKLQFSFLQNKCNSCHFVNLDNGEKGR